MKTGFIKLLTCLTLIATFPTQSSIAGPVRESPAKNASCPSSENLVITRSAYRDKLEGFWLGLSIGNWTGLVTEMDKIGAETEPFYTRQDWGQPDRPSIWGQGVPSDLSPTIDWVLRRPGEVWGSDDDSDIEFIYLDTLKNSQSLILTGEEIQSGWLRHIYSDADTPFRTKDGKPENFLWVSNQRTFDLMQAGVLPPLTGRPAFNPHYDMIDAQLTTEMFGALAPGRPDIALRMADLPIQTSASAEAADIARFYVELHARMAAFAEAPTTDRPHLQIELMKAAAETRKSLPGNQYPAKMYDFVLSKYQSGATWEQTRDAIYERYQLARNDGYEVTGRGLYCNGCFAGGINFAASLVSLFYGAGDMKETIKIATLAGWDSDNPAATWGGLYGLMLGRSRVENEFGGPLSDRFNIHRTRKGFDDSGMTTFGQMADDGLDVIDRVVRDLASGRVSTDRSCWIIPRMPEVKITPL